ncbi:MAG TPA: hypothetical protein VJ912_00310 [Candidatus Nanoarchaeia archaeon]|nr:hypothetical protein [Candidatus Nanoarchaeia archaeon]
MARRLSKTGIVLLVILGIIVLAVGSWVIRYYTAEPKGIVEMKEEVESGKHRRQAYEAFYDMYEQIQAYERQIENHEENLEYAEDKKERMMIRRNINGTKNEMIRLIHKYNSEARMKKSKGKFKAEDLPDHIDVEDYQ